MLHEPMKKRQHLVVWPNLGHFTLGLECRPIGYKVRLDGVNCILREVKSYPAAPVSLVYHSAPATSPGVCLTEEFCGLGGGMRSTECHFSCLFVRSSFIPDYNLFHCVLAHRHCTKFDAWRHKRHGALHIFRTNTHT